MSFLPRHQGSLLCRVIPTFLLTIPADELLAQSSRAFDREKPTMMIQADVGVPELYGLGVGFITESQWFFSLVANGLLLQGSNLVAREVGVQFGKSTKKNVILIIQPSLLSMPSGTGDGASLSFFVGFGNTGRVGSNMHGYIGWTTTVAHGHTPDYWLSLKLGLNYNLAAYD